MLDVDLIGEKDRLGNLAPRAGTEAAVGLEEFLPQPVTQHIRVARISRAAKLRGDDPACRVVLVLILHDARLDFRALLFGMLEVARHLDPDFRRHAVLADDGVDDLAQFVEHFAHGGIAEVVRLRQFAHRRAIRAAAIRAVDREIGDDLRVSAARRCRETRFEVWQNFAHGFERNA